jgi:hypothetical protein
MSLVSGLVVALAAISGGGCHQANYRPDLATRAYPWTLHRTQDVPIQCFREGSTVQILNSTPRGYDSVAIWINQRFLLEGVDLPAGESTMIDLWQFRDHLGEQFRAGGIWRTEPPMPVRLIEIQADPESPTVGLITIPPREL